MRRASALLLPVALLALVGCGVQGTWKLESWEPESAADYAFAKIVLNEDGTFSAEAAEGSKLESTAGKYEFAEGKLTFTLDDGRTRTYDADLRCPGTQLWIMHEPKEGGEAKAVYKREQ
jgi:hypothetical protein